jgi:hypothetical protein
MLEKQEILSDFGTALLVNQPFVAINSNLHIVQNSSSGPPLQILKKKRTLDSIAVVLNNWQKLFSAPKSTK